MKRFARYAALAAMAAPAVFADFSYEQTTKMTGGAMVKMLGVFSKQMREPIRSSVHVAGDRMAMVNANSVTVVDLSKETITTIDLQKKNYSVVTFAQMAEAMRQLEAKMNAKKDPNQPEMKFKADLKETGQTRQIQGMNAKQTVLTIDMEAAGEGGEKGAMRITADMWLASQVAGYDEVRKFHQKMASKVNWAPGGNMFTQGRSDLAKAFSNLYKEGAKVDGVPVLQITKFGAAGEGMPPAAGAPQQQQAQSEEKPSVGGAVAGRTLGRLGRFGGLGGLGRKKQQEEQPPAPAPQQTGSAAGAPASASLMEMETELSSFSSGPVDGSKFEVPAGFKQVESEMLKQLRK